MARVNPAAVTSAAEVLLSAALAGDMWELALADFAEAAGAKGAVLIGETPDFAARAGVRLSMMATPSIAAHIDAYAAGDIPRDPRLDRVRPRFGGGFLADYASFQPEELERDTYYNEHLRAHDLGWHACAFIGDWPGHSLYLNLKRERRRGHYAADDVAVLDRILPVLRTAAAIAHARLAARLDGLADAFNSPNIGLFALDALGCARPLNETAAALIGTGLTLGRGKLAASGQAGAKLEKAIARAVARPAEAGFALIETAGPKRRLIVRTVPVRGRAADLFAGAAALVLVEAWSQPAAPAPEIVAVLRDDFGLTGREARVAALVADSASPATAAKALGIAVGTARNHLKAAMAKVGVSRQVELAAFLRRLMR